jgi:hypothetical protein
LITRVIGDFLKGKKELTYLSMTYMPEIGCSFVTGTSNSLRRRSPKRRRLLPGPWVLTL